MGMEDDIGFYTPSVHRICALSAAAEFVESTLFHSQSLNNSSFPPLNCTLTNSSSSSQCNANLHSSGSERVRPPKIVFKSRYKKQIRGPSAEELSSTDSELSSLSCSAFTRKNRFVKAPKNSLNEARLAALRLVHLAAVACSNRSLHSEFDSVNSVSSIKFVKKLRSSRKFKSSATSSSSTRKQSVGWIHTVQSPSAIHLPFINSRPEASVQSTTTFYSGSPSFHMNPQDDVSNIFSTRQMESQVSGNTSEASQVRRNTSVEEKYRGKLKPKKSREESLGTRIQLRCTAIQKFLLDQTTGSEKRIREIFGNNPDTSKALRMLLKTNRVKRFGAGGRSNPFVYMAITPPTLSELEKLSEATED